MLKFLQSHDGFLRAGANSLQPSQPILPIMKIGVHRAKICTQERANRDVGRFQNLEGASNNVGGINWPPG